MYKVGDLVRVLYGEDKGRVYVVKGIGCNILGEDIYLHSNGVGEKINQLEPVTYLTTKEFIKLVEDMGLKTKEYNYDGRYIEISNNGIFISNIYPDRMYYFELDDISIRYYESFPYLYKLLDLYARTPLGLREEKEKLYTLQCPLTKEYLIEWDDNEYKWSSKMSREFTQKEIDNLPNQELIKVLKKEPVEENNNDK